MIKWIKYVIDLYEHWGELGLLFKLGFFELLVIYFISFLGILNSSYVVRYLLGALGVRTFFWDMVFLQNATHLLNYVPMKFGTLFRANYLKSHYGLEYSRFGVFFVYLTLLTIGSAATISLLSLLFFFGVTSYETKILAVLLLALLVFSFFFSFIPLPVPTSGGRARTFVKNFLLGRKEVASKKQELFVSALLLAGNFILSSVRLGVICYGMGQKIHPAGFLVLGALGFVVLFLSLTPGSLGIRELVVASGAVALGVPFQVGILVAVVDRAIMLSWSFVVGGLCAIWLWHKSPADFKKAERL